jgi:glucokinase
MAGTEDLFLGVDIGGTKVAAGLVNSQGIILSKTRIAMIAQGDAQTGLDCVRSAIDSVLAQNADLRISAIGLACPGPLDPGHGLVINSENLPCWSNYPLVQKVRGTYGLPVILDSDAKAAGMAEALWGSGAGYKSVFYATIGTGVGTAIILDNRVYHGRTGTAAEGGHMSIDYRSTRRCGCGKRGCIETFIAGPAIAERAREMLSAPGAQNDHLLQLSGGNSQSVTAEMVGQAWREKDGLATAVWKETADFLAIWLGNIIDLLEPDAIVIGGGVSEVIGDWLDYVREQLPAWSINQRCVEIPLLTAKYAMDSGIAGAAALCLALADQASPVSITK